MTREITQATVCFRPSAGSNLQAQEVTAYGGQFTLTLPFSIVGGTNVLDSVRVLLTIGRKLGRGGRGVLKGRRDVYNLIVAVSYDFNSVTFDDAVRKACRNAFAETLAAGLPVFYVDADGLNVMQAGDNRRFEIRWLPGAPSGANYEIVRELTAHAA